MLNHYNESQSSPFITHPGPSQGWSTRTHTCTRTYSSTVFSVLSCTLYLGKFMSTCTCTYLSTVTKNPVLMSTLRVLQSNFLKFQADRKNKVNCFSGPSSSVSNAPHLSFFRLEKSGLIYCRGIKIYIKNLPASSVFHKSGLRNTCLFF